MKLLKYKVTNFRSVNDSGWIECDDITTLVGINESGKSNLLLALWKLNPAREGAIDALHDLPVSKLSSLRDKLSEIVFIVAEFSFDEVTKNKIEEECKCKLSDSSSVTISRKYDGNYEIEYNEIEFLSNDEETEEINCDANQEKARKIILDAMPCFVYYSNYGNLSSKIYLPHAITWLDGGTVSGIETNQEQVRTLKVLFEFVNLKPKEILELGKDPKVMAMERNRYSSSAPSKDEIAKAERDKEQRSILLQSASGELTKKFKDWWKQGEYKFRFEADGDYFRIWVSDEKRPDEVGLELRSTGLQWFISFYLIFLVESQNNHKNSVLLLDEAGLTLHPLAQKDLYKFFDNLSINNQIINTTHSPFLVDTTNVDRCRVVYSDENGFTVASSNLREGNGALNAKSIYAVHAAMGLSVSDIMLHGCNPVIVEGPSDQFYLNAIKTFMIKEKIFTPSSEILFVPSGGVKGIQGICSILSSNNDGLPYVIVDSDRIGKDAVNKLKTGLYKEENNKIIKIEDYVNYENPEIEDIIPFELLKKGIDKLFNSVEDVDFEDQYEKTKPLVPQIEDFAMKHNVSLEKGWKVELAKQFKKLISKKNKNSIREETVEIWKKIFEKFE